MRKILLSTVFHLAVITTFAQFQWEGAPVYRVSTPRYYHTKFETAAYIDSTLWRNFLNWSLYNKDRVKREHTLPAIYNVPVWFVVDTAGRISEVNAIDSNHTFRETIRNTLLNCPHKWAPATQNGRAVKSYHKMILEFDLRKEQEP